MVVKNQSLVHMTWDPIFPNTIHCFHIRDMAFLSRKSILFVSRLNRISDDKDVSHCAMQDAFACDNPDIMSEVESRIFFHQMWVKFCHKILNHPFLSQIRYDIVCNFFS